MDLDRQVTRTSDPAEYDWLMSEWRLFAVLSAFSIMACAGVYWAVTALWHLCFG